MQNVNVDHIWRTLGPLGKYQWMQITSYLLSLIAWSFQTLNIVFIGYRPGFRCNPFPNDTLLRNLSNMKNIYKECEILTYENSTHGGIVTSTSCVNGWDYDTPADHSFTTKWDLVCDKEELAELTQVLYLVGMMIGTFIFPTLSDRFGRKPVMVISHVLLFAVSLGLSFSENYTAFVILRLLTGFFQQGLLAGTTLSLEILPTEYRHYSGITALLAWTSFGCLISPIAFALRNYPWKYLQITFAMCSSWSVLQWWVTDESLRWLIANGQIEKAKQIIKKACWWNNTNYTEVLEKVGLDSQIEMKSSEPNNTNNVLREFNPLNQEYLDTDHKQCDVVFNEEAKNDLIVQRYTLFDIFKHRRIIMVSMILWYTWICDSLVYLGLYMISSDLYGDRYINFFLSALIEYPASLFEYFSLARIGRKWTIVTGHFVAAVGLAVSNGLTYTAEGNTSMLATATAFTLIGKMGVTTAYNALYLTTPELYPTNMRNMGLGVCSFMEKVGSMVAPFSRNVSSKIKWLPACVFATLCLITVVLFAFVPETNGVELPTTIEELKEWYRVNKFDLNFGKNKHAKKQQGKNGDHSEKQKSVLN